MSRFKLIFFYKIFFFCGCICLTTAETPLTYTPLTDEVSVKVQEACKDAMPPGQVLVTPPGCVLPKNYKSDAQRILDLEVKEDDVWLVSFPKCGTTWAQELLWLLTNNFDFKRANAEYFWQRVLFIDYKPLCAEGNTEPDNLDILTNFPSPRVIKTHMPIELMPKQIWTKKPKMIHMSRNAMDTAISYYHHYRLWNNYKGSIELFLQAFLEEKVVFSPYWQYELAFWELRKTYDNILYITYEEMRKDHAGTVKKVADFLGVQYTKEQETELLDHLSFEKMRVNRVDNFEDEIKLFERDPDVCRMYLREGKVGGWKTAMPEEYQKKFKTWIDNNAKGSDYLQQIIFE